MKKLLALFVILTMLLSCAEEENLPVLQEVQTKNTSTLLINNSTVYKVENNAVWTASLNELQVLTKFSVTPETTIQLNGQPAHLSQLRPGFTVRIDYYRNNMCSSPLPCYVAVRINARSR